LTGDGGRCNVARVSTYGDHDSRLTLAEILIDLAKDPDKLFQLQDAATPEEKLAVLRSFYGERLTAGHERLFQENLRQIRVKVEADVAASDPHTHSITWFIITW
jgi:hypothetical protein